MTLDVKKRRHFEIALIFGNAGMFLVAMNAFAFLPIPTRDKSIVSAVIAIIAAIAFVFFLGSRYSRAGTALMSTLPQSRLYVASISLSLIVVGIFRIMGAMGMGRSMSLVAAGILLLSIYVLALFPKSTDFLLKNGYSSKRTHTAFLTVLGMMVLSFVLHLIMVR